MAVFGLEHRHKPARIVGWLLAENAWAPDHAVVGYQYLPRNRPGGLTGRYGASDKDQQHHRGTQETQFHDIPPSSQLGDLALGGSAH